MPFDFNRNGESGFRGWNVTEDQTPFAMFKAERDSKSPPCRIERDKGGAPGARMLTV